MEQGTESKDVSITETLGRTEQYIEDNKKVLSYIVGALVVVVGGYFAYQKLIIGPQEEEARGQMFVAERYFEMDSLRLAVNGDGNYLGFQSIVEEYGSTPSGNLARYYLGMCLLRQGKYEDAVNYLSDYNAGDQLTGALAAGGIGDANMEMGKAEEAASWYMKAASYSKNKFTTPVFLMKAGLAFEESGKYANAVAAYEDLKTNFADTNEGKEADKYIARAGARVN